MTIGNCLEKLVSEIPNGVALRYFHEKAWCMRTWKEFHAGVKQMAQAYGEQFSLKPSSENVALMLGNGPDWIESYLACAGMGVSVVPLDPKLHSEEVAFILKDSNAVVLTTDAEHLNMLKLIVPELPFLRAVVIVGAKQTEFEPIGSVKVFAYERLRQNVRETSIWEQQVAQDEDVASVIYTSGTTGHPKGAMLTHANFINDIDGALGVVSDDLTVNENDTLFVVLPLFHAFSFNTNFILSLRKGCTQAFVRSLYTIAEDMRILKPTIVMSVPLLAEKMFTKIDQKLKSSKKAQFLMRIGLKALVFHAIKKGLGGKLRFMIVGGAPCPHHVLEGYKRLNIDILEGYGLTECAPIVSLASPYRAKIGTIGVKLPNIEVRIHEPNAQGVGELQVRGPITMKGYWHQEEATQEAFEGDWLKTGDLASVDAQGYYTICGRKKALIVNREGKNIYPEEVENRIATDPLVADCIVVGYITGGIPGEKVGCVVHPNLDLLKEQYPNGMPSWDEIVKVTCDHIHALCQHVADYKRIRKIVVSKEPLVRTSIQKVRRVVYKGTLDE